MDKEFIEQQVLQAIDSILKCNGNAFVTFAKRNGNLIIEGSSKSADNVSEKLWLGDSVMVNEDDSQYNLLLGVVHAISNDKYLITRTRRGTNVYGWFKREELVKI